MAYFQRDKDGGNRGYDPRSERQEYEEEFRPPEEGRGPEPVYDDGFGDSYEDSYDDGFDDGYDDGFDELAAEEPEEELSEEERREEQKRKFRIAAGVGDLAAVLAGVAVILVLTAFLINMIQFVSSDISQNFSLWATKF